MSILLVILLIAVLIVTTARSQSGRGGRESTGTAIRRFFQYLLQYGLVVVAAVGVSGLLGRVLRRDALVLADQADLARSLSFTVVGVPLLVLVIVWTRRRMAADPREVTMAGWNIYLSIAELTALAVTTFAAQDILLWLARVESYDGGALSRFVVWGAVWASHWWLDLRLAPRTARRDHHLAGSAFGLWLTASGFAGTIAAVAAAASTLQGKDLFVATDHPIVRSLVGMFVGAVVWFVYWVRSASKSERDLHWQAYVMLAGVAGGLIASVVSATVALYDVLVWFLGTPDTTDPWVQFRSVTNALGALLAGLLVWWYHRRVLAAEQAVRRDEPSRVYEYLVAAIGLLAAAVGVAILIVAFFESFTSGQLIAGPGAGNTLILASTLLVVGVPVWAVFWQRIRRAVIADRAAECASPTRRIFLFILFGVAGVAAVIALLVAVYFLFDGVVTGSGLAATVRRMRWGVAILVTTGAIAAYHWRVYRSEREEVVPRGRRHIVLIGAVDAELADAVARELHCRVERWVRTDGIGESQWSMEAVLQAVEAAGATDVVVTAAADGLRALPVARN